MALGTCSQVPSGLFVPHIWMVIFHTTSLPTFTIIQPENSTMSSPNTTPTAQMPMPGGPQQQQLLSLLEDYETYWEISHKLPDVAFELRNDSIVKARKFGASQLHSLPEYDDEDRMKMLKLLLSMDRTVIRAIIGGTVAHDTFHNRVPWLEMPGPLEKVPGVYVVGLSRDGCDGEFLKVEEMKELILGIQRYIKGFEFINQRSQAKWSSGPVTAPLSAFQQGLVDWVKKVNGVSTPGILDSAQYIEQDSDLPSIQALLSMFESWCRASLDPTQKVRQTSSPLFVGFSVEMNATLATCDQAQLLSMNKPMVLTVQILRALGHPVKACVQVALRIWEVDQVFIAEQLVVALAGSMVYDHGFSHTETSFAMLSSMTSAESVKALGESHVLIMGCLSTWLDNVKGINKEIDNRLEFAQVLDRLATKVPVAIDAINECAATLDKITLPSRMTWSECEQLMKDIEEGAKADIEEHRLLKRQAEILLMLTRRRYGIEDGDEDDEDNEGDEDDEYSDEYEGIESDGREDDRNDGSSIE